LGITGVGPSCWFFRNTHRAGKSVLKGSIKKRVIIRLIMKAMHEEMSRFVSVCFF
jgi:hypothetical protein